MTARISAGSPAALPTPAWIDKWLAACQNLAELGRSNPMTDAVIEEIDGRMIRVGGQWLAELAPGNYPRLDLQRGVLQTVPPPPGGGGAAPSRSRPPRPPARSPRNATRA